MKNENPLLLTIDDAAKLLGLHRRTVYTLISGGKLPRSYKLGGRRVFRRADLETWIDLGLPAQERFETITRAGARR